MPRIQSQILCNGKVTHGLAVLKEIHNDVCKQEHTCLHHQQPPAAGQLQFLEKTKQVDHSMHSLQSAW